MIERASVFHVQDISRIYRMGEVEVHALRHVDLDLFQGELVVILGPSGGGKSTLLNILGGLDTPTSGNVTFRDHDLTAADDRELTRYRREHVGFVFQFYNLIPSLTALENVALVTEISDDPMSPTPAGLGDGYRVDAHIVVWESSNAIKVPTNAIFRSGTSWSVFVAESGRARLRSIETVHRNSTETEVTSGLTEGQKVIAHPPALISDGVRVAPR